MINEHDIQYERGDHLKKGTPEDAIYLVRFMVWAYDEVSQNLKDDVLKSAIKAILYYMTKRYGVDPVEYKVLMD